MKQVVAENLTSGEPFGHQTGNRWAEVPGFPGYEISDCGQVRRSLTKRLLKHCVGFRGYLVVEMRRYDGAYKQMRISRLVLMAFVGPAPEGQHAAHENGINTDNRLENLAWKTRKENEADKVRHGTAPRGERNGLAKLKSAQVLTIKNRLMGGCTDSSLAREYGVSENAINDIRRGVTWWHIGSPDGAGRHSRTGRPRKSPLSPQPQGEQR